jgi:hypothetical protein
MTYKIICAWCRQEIGEKESAGSQTMQQSITHSICEGCQAKEKAKLAHLKKSSAGGNLPSSPLLSLF